MRRTSGTLKEYRRESDAKYTKKQTGSPASPVARFAGLEACYFPLYSKTIISLHSFCFGLPYIYVFLGVVAPNLNFCTSFKYGSRISYPYFFNLGI